MAGRNGVNQQDVWQAADALLLEGERPTVEKIRARIGRGSPNTVGPLLDGWFRSLGRRIKDPLAFRAPPAVPDPVSEAATQFWEIALEAARAACAAEIAAEQASLAVLRGELEQQRASLAQEILRQQAAAEAQVQLVESLRSQLEAVRRSADRDKAELSEQIRQWQQRLEATEAESAMLASQLEQARQARTALLGELAEVKAGCEKDLAAAMLRHDQAETRARDMHARLDAALARVRKLEQALDEHEQSRQQQDARLQSLQSELQQTRAALSGARAELEPLRLLSSRTERECAELRETLRAERLHSRQLAGMLEDARKLTNDRRAALKRVQWAERRKRF